MQLEASLEVLILFVHSCSGVLAMMNIMNTVSEKELSRLVRQISHNSMQKYLLKINPSCLNLNCFSTIIARVWKPLSVSVGYLEISI